MIPPDMMMVGGSVVLYHLDSFMVTLDLMSGILLLLICLLDVM